jgi:hypothetical protein
MRTALDSSRPFISGIAKSAITISSSNPFAMSPSASLPLCAAIDTYPSAGSRSFARISEVFSDAWQQAGRLQARSSGTPWLRAIRPSTSLESPFLGLVRSTSSHICMEA